MMGKTLPAQIAVHIGSKELYRPSRRLVTLPAYLNTPGLGLSLSSMRDHPSFVFTWVGWVVGSCKTETGGDGRGRSAQPTASTDFTHAAVRTQLKP